MYHMAILMVERWRRWREARATERRRRQLIFDDGPLKPWQQRMVDRCRFAEYGSCGAPHCLEVDDMLDANGTDHVYAYCTSVGSRLWAWDWEDDAEPLASAPDGPPQDEVKW
jgi:diadenosine tetraphosphatase ApaH/serine/threonine PP2A family protein phosphatase